MEEYFDYAVGLSQKIWDVKKILFEKIKVN